MDSGVADGDVLFGPCMHVVALQYQHLDFIWGQDAAELVYPQVVEMLLNKTVSVSRFEDVSRDGGGDVDADVSQQGEDYG